MQRYDGLSDDFYINMNLNNELELPQSRETVLHFFEQMQRRYPTMRNFYTRERGELVLEEDKEPGHYRWCSVEPKRLCSGFVNPPTLDDALEQHRQILDLVPYALAVSPLDCESLNVMFGFDFTYRGNHNQLLVDALGIAPAFERMASIPGATVLCHEPAFQIALDTDCRLQCRVSIETRTSAYHVRTSEYPEEQLSVYLTARRYGSLEPGESFVNAVGALAQIAAEVVDQCVIEQILRPLQQTIAIK